MIVFIKGRLARAAGDRRALGPNSDTSSTLIVMKVMRLIKVICCNSNIKSNDNNIIAQ